MGVVVHRANLVDITMGTKAIAALSAYALLHCHVDISDNIKSGKRWVAERTFAWLNNSRRLSKDYEIRTNSAEDMIKLSHIHTLLKLL